VADREEKKNQKIGAAVSIGVHAVVLLLFFFLMAWKEPNPPNPEYGIELNLGLEQQGFGTQQPQPQPVREPVEEQESEPQPVQEEIVEETEEVTEEPVTTPETSREVVQDEGPDVIEQQPAKQPQPQPKKEPKPEPKPEPVKQQPKKEVDTRALFPGSGDKNKKPDNAASQGDQPNQQGDQGSKQGKVDARALYGKPGGGDGGPLINLTNWVWDRTQVSKDNSSERGKIVFEIIVDQYGEITSYRAVETTVSPSVVNYYARQVEDFTFTFNPSSPGTSPAAASKGTITFFINSN